MKEIALLARGSWQEKVLAEMLSDNGCPNPVLSLRGSARKYERAYYRSFLNLLDRAEQAGYALHVVNDVYYLLPPNQNNDIIGFTTSLEAGIAGLLLLILFLSLSSF